MPAYDAVGATTRAGRVAVGLLAALAAVIVAGCGSSSSGSPATAQATMQPQTASSSSSDPGPSRLGPERVPLELGPSLAPASSTAPGTPVDGIRCAPVEQLAYHIHAHLQVYVDGSPRSLPGAIGLIQPVASQAPAGPFYGARGCYYWLHTHTPDGVIHIESPTPRIYSLGNFFDEWRQPLGPDGVAGANGAVTAFLNGRRWRKNPRQIPLLPRAAIQLDVGSPLVPFRTISWAGTVL